MSVGIGCIELFSGWISFNLYDLKFMQVLTCPLYDPTWGPFLLNVDLTWKKVTSKIYYIKSRKAEKSMFQCTPDLVYGTEHALAFTNCDVTRMRKPSVRGLSGSAGEWSTFRRYTCRRASRRCASRRWASQRRRASQSGRIRTGGKAAS